MAYGPMVAAVLAAAAAIATAVISSSSNAADTQRRIEHETALRREETVGAARVLAKELATAEVYMQGMLRIDRLIPYEESYDVRISQEDQKLIAHALGVDRWQRVSSALSNLDTLGSFVQDQYGSGHRRLHRGHVAVFELNIASIDRAWAALDPLSGTPKISDDPFGAG